MAESHRGRRPGADGGHGATAMDIDYYGVIFIIDKHGVDFSFF
jgi:hypothetical protein